MKKIVLHIAGPSGSGKSYIGALLRNKHANYIRVVDLDDITEKPNPKDAVKMVIDKSRKSVIVFVGHNVDKNGDFFDIPNLYKGYYLFYNVDKILKRRFNRDIQYLNNHKIDAYNRFKSGTEFIFSYSQWKDEIEKDKKIYLSKNYLFGSQRVILANIGKIIASNK